jgi:hypothetical protein
MIPSQFGPRNFVDDSIRLDDRRSHPCFERVHAAASPTGPGDNLARKNQRDDQAFVSMKVRLPDSNLRPIRSLDNHWYKRGYLSGRQTTSKPSPILSIHPPKKSAVFPHLVGGNKGQKTCTKMEGASEFVNALGPLQGT